VEATDRPTAKEREQRSGRAEGAGARRTNSSVVCSSELCFQLRLPAYRFYYQMRRSRIWSTDAEFLHPVLRPVLRSSSRSWSFLLFKFSSFGSVFKRLFKSGQVKKKLFLLPPSLFNFLLLLPSSIPFQKKL
jgi:hypothetical protein